MDVGSYRLPKYSGTMGWQKGRMEEMEEEIGFA
jgi:hypothetical protein